MTTKAKNIAYWITTILLAFFMSGGIAQFQNIAPTLTASCPILATQCISSPFSGIWKILGAIAILVPRYPRLKEWAYAGIFFDLTGAAASCAAVGVYGAYAFHIIAPLVIAGLCVASWALRPESRRIGVLFPAKNDERISARAANIA